MSRQPSPPCRPGVTPLSYLRAGVSLTVPAAHAELQETGIVGNWLTDPLSGLSRLAIEDARHA
jgi:hypothetical protein